jgi:hypothetical protein
VFILFAMTTNLPFLEQQIAGGILFSESSNALRAVKELALSGDLVRDAATVEVMLDLISEEYLQMAKIQNAILSETGKIDETVFNICKNLLETKRKYENYAKLKEADALLGVRVSKQLPVTSTGFQVQSELRQRIKTTGKIMSDDVLPFIRPSTTMPAALRKTTLLQKISFHFAEFQRLGSSIIVQSIRGVAMGLRTVAGPLAAIAVILQLGIFIYDTITTGDLPNSLSTLIYGDAGAWMEQTQIFYISPNVISANADIISGRFDFNQNFVMEASYIHHVIQKMYEDGQFNKLYWELPDFFQQYFTHRFVWSLGALTYEDIYKLLMKNEGEQWQYINRIIAQIPPSFTEVQSSNEALKYYSIKLLIAGGFVNYYYANVNIVRQGQTDIMFSEIKSQIYWQYMLTPERDPFKLAASAVSTAFKTPAKTIFDAELTFAFNGYVVPHNFMRLGTVRKYIAALYFLNLKTIPYMIRANMINLIYQEEVLNKAESWTLKQGNAEYRYYNNVISTRQASANPNVQTLLFRIYGPIPLFYEQSSETFDFLLYMRILVGNVLLIYKYYQIMTGYWGQIKLVVEGLTLPDDFVTTTQTIFGYDNETLVVDTRNGMRAAPVSVEDIFIFLRIFARNKGTPGVDIFQIEGHPENNVNAIGAKRGVDTSGVSLAVHAIILVPVAATYQIYGNNPQAIFHPESDAVRVLSALKGFFYDAITEVFKTKQEESPNECATEFYEDVVYPNPQPDQNFLPTRKIFWQKRANELTESAMQDYYRNGGIELNPVVEFFFNLFANPDNNNIMKGVFTGLEMTSYVAIAMAPVATDTLIGLYAGLTAFIAYHNLSYTGNMINRDVKAITDAKNAAIDAGMETAKEIVHQGGKAVEVAVETGKAVIQAGIDAANAGKDVLVGSLPSVGGAGAAIALIIILYSLAKLPSLEIHNTYVKEKK